MSRDWAEHGHIRIYASVQTDEKFKSVFPDDRAFAAYVRLLLWAKPHYPAPAPIPRSVATSALKTLQEAGIITVNGDFFTIIGLAKEMAEVPDAAHRAGGLVRAATAAREGGRFAPSDDTPLTGEVPDGREDIEAFVEVRRKAPTPRQLEVLNNVLERHDVSGPTWAAEIIRSHPNDPIGAVIEADKAWRAERKAGAVRDENESADRNRRKPGLRDPLLQEIAATLAAREPVTA
jgi:hypothetical protein